MADRFEAFERSLGDDAPPPATPPLLRALWHGLRGEWQAAHELAQADDGADAAWVHAWLHRIEGDPDNAGYWYRMAGRAAATGDAAAEGRAIARSLLAAGTRLDPTEEPRP